MASSSSLCVFLLLLFVRTSAFPCTQPPGRPVAAPAASYIHPAKRSDWSTRIRQQQQQQQQQQQRQRKRSSTTSRLLSHEEDFSMSLPPTTSSRCHRRNLLQAAGSSSHILMFMMFSSSPPQAAVARNLPESNEPQDLLTTRMRKKPGSVESLIPLVQLEHLLQAIQVAVMEDMNQMEDLPRIPLLVRDLEAFVNSSTANSVTERKWKQLFDAYSNPVSYKQRYMDQNAFLVYYTNGFDGPGRPSIMEKDDENDIIQTQQYGARNDAWVAWQDICDQVTFFSEDVLAGSTSFEQEKKRLLKSLDQCQRAFDQYFQTVPPQDLQQAQHARL